MHNYLHTTAGYGHHKYYRDGRRISKEDFDAADKSGLTRTYDRKNGQHYFRWS